MGLKIPLKRVAEVKEVVGMRSITRENGQRFIAIQCNVVGRDIGSFVKEAEEKMQKNLKLPPGYYMRWGGQFKFQQEAFRRLSIVIPITLGLIVILLFMSFASFKDTFLILFNIPLALSGGAFALFLSGGNLSVPSAIGFIALFGIALENGMVLISFINRLMQEGREDAIIKGSVRRLRAVLMTAFTTALGLIPLVFSTGTGSEVQRPLAIVVVGGILTSTLLTLVVLPAFKSFSFSLRKGGGYAFSWFIVGGAFFLLFSSAEAITLKEMLEFSMKNNPAILRAKKELKAVEGSIIQAGLYPNPVLSLEAEDIGRKSPELTGTLNQVIPLGGKLSKRKKIFLSEKDIARHTLDLVKLEVYRGAKSSFYYALMLKEREKVLGKIGDLLRRFVEITEERVRLGESPRVDLRRAQIELERNQMELFSVRKEYQAALWRLATFMGKKEVDFSVEGSLKEDILQKREERKGYIKRDIRVPEVFALKAMIERERARYQFEKSLRIPDIGISAGARYIFNEGWAVVGGISILLPIFDRRQGELMRIKRISEALQKELERLQLEVKGRVESLLLRVAALEERILSLEKEIIPLAESNLEDITEGYRVGKFSILEVLHAQNTLFSSQKELIDIWGEYRQIEIELESLLEFTEIKRRWF